jgi:hypothetical protein
VTRRFAGLPHIHWAYSAASFGWRAIDIAMLALIG